MRKSPANIPGAIAAGTALLAAAAFFLCAGSGTPAQAADFGERALMAAAPSGCVREAQDALTASGGGEAVNQSDGSADGGTETGLESGIQGVVGIDTGAAFYMLDGPGIKGGTLTAQSVSFRNLSYSTPIAGGGFTLSHVLPGWYTVTASLTYEDHILYDAQFLSSGCAAPPGGVLLKQVISEPLRIFVARSGFTSVLIGFKEPLVMVHGIQDCYQKWYGGSSPDSSSTAHWDDYARSQGVLSFTPNYIWWGSDATWEEKADELFEQMALDLERLSTSAPGQTDGSGGSSVPFAIVAHDMGGLVVRVLASGLHRSDALVASANRVFLLGVPESGTDLVLGGGTGNIMGTQAIVRGFNTVYPDFGSLEDKLFPIAGDKDWWNQGTSDGSVPLDSVFLISQIGCSPDAFGYPLCKSFPALALPGGGDHVFPYGHYELGGPESTTDILAGVVLPRIQPAALVTAPPPERLGVPEAPVSNSIWGTTARTTGTASGTLLGSAARTGESSYTFLVSQTDGMAITAAVAAGSGTFQVTDPAGTTYAMAAAPGGGKTAGGSANDLFTQFAPLPGQWTLTAIPDSGGMSFSASCYEDSPFGVMGYPTQHSYTAGQFVVLRLDFEGDLSGVSGTSAQVEVTDTTGNQQTIPLYDDGQHDDGAAGDQAFGGFMAAPVWPGTYHLVFYASGTNQGTAFSRVAFDKLTVLSPGHTFTGTFSDRPYTAGSGSLYDGITFLAGIQAPHSGSYTLSADLLDTDGNFINHATATQRVATPSATVTLNFDLGASYCVQFGQPFQVVNLSLSDPSSLNPLDVWPAPVQTTVYAAGAFRCNQGTPGPEVKGLDPSQGVKGQVLTLLVGGNSFGSDATVTSDPDIEVLKTLPISDRLLVAAVSISPTAAPGGHPLTVTNSNGTSATLPDAFNVVTDQPPVVTFQVPRDGDSLQGVTPVSVAVAGDSQVSRVEFYLDGALMATDSQFPFKWSLDASTLTKGVHALSATAYDTAGQSASTAIVVYKDPPTVSSVRALSAPFRIKIKGQNFRPGLKAYIGGDSQPWSFVAVRNGKTVVLGGDGKLKDRFPPGQAVAIRLLNRDGTEVTTSFTNVGSAR